MLRRCPGQRPLPKRIRIFADLSRVFFVAHFSHGFIRGLRKQEFMKRQNPLTAALLTGSLLAALHCKAQIFLDQYQTNAGAAPRIGGDTSLAQTFTAGVSGELTSVSLRLSRNNVGETNALLVSITDTQNGLPGAQLGLASLARISSDYRDWYSIGFQLQSVHLCANHQYALVLSCPGSFLGIDIGGSVYDFYTWGQAMQKDGMGAWYAMGWVYDLQFKTYMQVATDTTPPAISVSASPKILWPPNGAMVPITVTGHITDDECDGSGINLSTPAYAVTDDDGKVEPSGPIQLQPDGSYDFVILLQASRRAFEVEGRQYTITVTAQDNAGNTGTASTGVTVPHDRGNSSRRPYVY
ncbi:MAG: hypothetical protein C5B58_00390 [Acidobacteria bacterium]|nr:MAG: hypothetical protein C5B58_00390 [Acidobacteriota bacterium]